MGIVAFIESNTTGTGHLLAQKALARGHRVAFLTADPERHPWLVQEMIHPVLVDTGDREAMLEVLRGLPDLVAVLSSSSYFLEPAAELAAALGLPGSSAEAVRLCSDKGLLSELLDKAGVGSPPTSRVTTLAEAEAAWAGHGSRLGGGSAVRLIVKPISGSGSVGVRSHTERQSFLAHVEALLATSTNERGIPVDPVVLVQDFIDGEEFSVEMLSTAQGHHLVGITRKYLGPPPHCLEIGHDYPADLPPAPRQAIEAEVRAALEAVGWTLGPTHAEVKLHPGGVTIIEINPRLGGGMIPVLIEHATGVDVLEDLLELHLGGSPQLTPSRQGSASICFIIPDSPGRLARLELPQVRPAWLVDVFTKKGVGDALVLEGNFLDRIGHVMAVGASRQESRSRAQEALASVRLVVEQTAEDREGGGRSSGPGGQGDTGRLRRTLHPEALAIVRKVPAPEARRRELSWLAAVDEAHLVMLVEAGILPPARVRPVLGEIQRMKAEGFGDLAHSVAPRGTYLLYEEELNRRLGSENAGLTHTGRSRNDINAALFRVRLRQPFEAVYRSLWHLRSSLLQQAATHLDVAMPIYSQFQPGLPGTYAYYLMGVEEALSRDQQALRDHEPALNTSTLGACAGGGTPFPIRCERTAELMGFSRVHASALDAVASRDLGLRLMAAAATAGMHVSRLAQDFQLWSTLEFGFLSLPDELAGGSSMMPQKKNPYLLEMIKGRASRLAGHWSGAVLAMSKTPFSNAVEVGTEAVEELSGALDTFSQAATLMGLLVMNAEIKAEATERSARMGVVCASLVTDTLVQQTGIPFRAAHHQVGAAIREAMDAGQSPEAAVQVLVAQADLGASPLEWAHRYEYGGGPGKEATRSALAKAEARLEGDARWLSQTTGDWAQAERLRAEAVSSLSGEGSA